MENVVDGIDSRDDIGSAVNLTISTMEIDRVLCSKSPRILDTLRMILAVELVGQSPMTMAIGEADLAKIILSRYANLTDYFGLRSVFVSLSLFFSLFLCDY